MYAQVIHYVLVYIIVLRFNWEQFRYCYHWKHVTIGNMTEFTEAVGPSGGGHRISG